MENNPIIQSITSEEQTQIQQLKDRINNRDSTNPLDDTLYNSLKNFTTSIELDERLFYIRWIRATSGNVNKAFDMVVEYFKWRQRINIDNLKPGNFDDLFSKIEFIEFLGFDKDGCPGVILNVGKFVPGSLQPYEKVEELVALAIELITHDLRIASKGVLERFVIVVDYDGWGLSCIDTKLDRVILGTCQAYYPERLKEALLLRAPWIFSTAWAVVKVFLDEKTKQKISFISEGDINTELKKRFNDDQILERYGGTFKGKSVKNFILEKLGSDEPLSEFYKKRQL
ncbi:hypothetical protein ABK040_007212 [Willaertia magna]